MSHRDVRNNFIKKLSTSVTLQKQKSYSSAPILFTIIIISPPNKAITKKAHFILRNSEIKPTIGGTNKKPKYPIVEIEVKAEPLLNFDDLAAMLKTKGTTQETPTP